MADEVASLLVAIRGDASDLETAIKGVESDISRLEKTAGGVSGKAKRTARETGEAIDAATKPIQRTSMLLSAGGVAAAKFAIDFEDNFASVKKTVDGTPEQLEKVKKGIIDLTTVGVNGKSALPMTTAELTELAAAGGQLGISTENIVEFAEVMAQLGTATNLVGSEGAAALARFRNVMQIPESEIRNVGSSIVDLGNNMATTEAEILEMANRMGKYGATVKIGAADVMGYSAALSSLGVEAQLGGSAIGRTWLSIEAAVAKGGAELKEFADISGKCSAEFQEAWGDNASGAFMDVLKGLNEADNLTLSLEKLGINNTQDIQAMMALATNYDLVAEAIGRANSAYAENTALQTEADAKADTTAGQMQIAKNNLVEAGRSIGEVFLPAVNSGLVSITDFAKKLSGLSEDTKKNIVSFGTGVIAVGAAAKGTASVMKTVGDVTEGVSKLKTAFKGVSKSGATLAKIGPIIAKGITSPAGIAALAVAGIGVVAYKAYKEWYKSEHLWAEGMNEQAEEIKKSADRLTQLNALKKELGELELTVQSSNSSQADIEVAETRIKEIAQLLEDEYNLKINVDADDLSGAVDKIQQAVNILSIEERGNLTQKGNEYLGSVITNSGKYKEAVEQLKYQRQAVEENRLLLDDIAQYNNQIAITRAKFGAGQINNDEYNAQLRNIMGDFVTNSTAGSAFKERYKNIYGSDFDVRTSTHQGISELANMQEQLEATGAAAQKSLSEVEAQIKEFEQAANSAADSYAKVLASDIASGNTTGAEQDLANLQELGQQMRLTGADTTELATKVAAAKTGFTDFNAAIQAGKSEDVAAAFYDYKVAIGESGAAAAEGAALVKNGFKTSAEAVEKGDAAVKAVIKDLNAMAKAKGVTEITDDLSAMARKMELIPSGTALTIDVDGNIEFLKSVDEIVENIRQKSNTTITVDASGNVSALETADEKLNELWSKNSIDIKLNVDTGGFDILDKSSNKLLGNITADGKINWTTENVEKPTEAETLANGKIDWGVGKVEKPSQSQLTATGTITWKSNNVPKPQFAKGTKKAPGGLAMVNDEEGISDPRELIIDKGQAYIPQGKNVILPLSKGAKVYTARQTKDIMKNLGIPRYAKGKDNSEAFTSERDSWTHYTNTHAVTVTEELEKWVELSEKFKNNAADAEEIQEQIFSLMRKQNEELNEQSKEYILARAQLNDWGKYGDDPFSAYSRVEARNIEAVNAGRMTATEFAKTMTEFGESLLRERTEQSFGWLEHEDKYNNITDEEYIAGLDRMAEYTVSMFNNMLVSETEFNSIMTDIADRRKDREIEAAQKVAEAWEKSADNWLKIRNVYDDWELVNDSKSNYYIRSLGSIEELYRSQKISWDEYMDMSQEAYLSFYEAEEERTEKELDELRDLIDETESKFREQEQEIRDSWNVEDRETDKDEVTRLLGIYKDSVTEAGQKRYKELLEEKKQIDREEELYDLEQTHNKRLEELEEEYTEQEKQNKEYLRSLRTDTFNIFSAAADINTSVEGIKAYLANTASNNNKVLSQLVNVLTMIAGKDTVVYNDNRNIRTTSGTSSRDIIKKLTGTVVSGFGDVLISR